MTPGTDTASTPEQTGSVDFGYVTRTLRFPRFSTRLPVRIAVVTTILFAVSIAMAMVAIRFGDFPLSLREVITSLLGNGQRFQQMIVLEWRLPIAVAAVVFGALLGLGGAIFQSLTRNPLGSPDVIGFDAGSYTAVVITMLVVGTQTYWTIAWASIIGGLLTASVVYALSYRRGIEGFRFIIVGIGVAAMLGSVNSYLITRADIGEAIAVGFWGAGSISRVSWSGLVPALIIASVIVIAAAALAPSLRRMELGDDAATTLGTRLGPTRLGLIIVGVATTALVTATAGPIAFIALAAPQLARRLTRSAGVSLVSAAAMGAALLAGAHLLSLLIASWYRSIPVGLITVCLGGIYLIGLLVHEARQHYGLRR